MHRTAITHTVSATYPDIPYRFLHVHLTKRDARILARRINASGGRAKVTTEKTCIACLRSTDISGMCDECRMAEIELEREETFVSA